MSAATATAPLRIGFVRPPPLLAANVGRCGATLMAGVAVVMTRAIAGNIPPLTLAFLRCAQGSLALALPLLALAPHQFRVQRRDLPMLALLGAIVFAAFPAAYNAGLESTPAPTGALLLATSPLWGALLARATRRESLRPPQLAGILLNLAGIVLLLGGRGLPGRGAGGDLFGEGCMLVAGLCLALYSLLAKRTLTRLPAATVVTYAMAFGTLLLLPGALAEGGLTVPVQRAGRTLLLVVALGVAGNALQWFGTTHALVYLTPTRSLVYANLSPLVATALAAACLGERLTWSFALALAAVVGGVVLVNAPLRTSRKVASTDGAGAMPQRANSSAP